MSIIPRIPAKMWWKARDRADELVEGAVVEGLTYEPVSSLRKCKEGWMEGCDVIGLCVYWRTR
jgi:hypothetical protein